MHRLLVLGSLLLAGAVIPVPAHATDGLAWQWEGQTRSYQVQGQLRLPEYVWLRALNNDEARAFEVGFDLVMTCAPVGSVGKSAWDVVCRLDDVGLTAVALPGDKGKLTPILTEWDGRLTGASVELEWTADGRIRNVGFVDMERRNRRDGENIEVLRQLMTRVFSAFDLQLPKRGDDKGDGEWVQKSMLVFGFMGNAGTLGTASTVHKVMGIKGTQVKIGSEGSGVLANAASTRVVAGQEEIANQYKMEMSGEAMWDGAAGHLIRRQVVSDGTPTAGSELADGYQGLRYIQAYKIDLLPADAPPPPVMATAEVDGVFGS